MIGPNGNLILESFSSIKITQKGPCVNLSGKKSKNRFRQELCIPKFANSQGLRDRVKFQGETNLEGRYRREPCTIGGLLLHIRARTAGQLAETFFNLFTSVSGPKNRRSELPIKSLDVNPRTSAKNSLASKIRNG
jgi:hypothetical protein